MGRSHRNGTLDIKAYGDGKFTPYLDDKKKPIVVIQNRAERRASISKLARKDRRLLSKS